ncbi:MAG TPA: allantoinase AllB [Thermoanaerobaculia bacterium]|nr:allantoinase AllB [Thermoanaerobaculia bacterium]
MPVLFSRRVVTPEGVRPAAIHVEGEKIVAVTEPPPGMAAPHVDYGHLVIMPGLVDSHVHVNEPGRTEWEGFRTATRAAAAGGVTTIVDMPLNSIPPTTTLDHLQRKAETLEGKCHVDVALWGGVIPGNTAELQPMIDAGARGFKCFLVDSGVEEFPAVTERDLRNAAAALSGTGAPLLVHAELPGPIEAAAAAGGDPHAYGTWLRSRPNRAEDEAIDLLLRVCRDSGARIHVVHLSSASAVEIIERAHKELLPLSAETTPHYLHFAAEEIERDRTEFKCAPPIRERDNRERLWRALAAGTVQIVVSDHSPCTPELKRADFMKAWGGIASVQFVLPVVWTGAMKRGLTLEQLARWTSESPALLARLPGKGAIAPGRDADFVVWSPEERFTVTEETIQHRHKTTPYRGETLHGVVKATWLRGEPVFENGSHAPASGRWLR